MPKSLIDLISEKAEAVVGAPDDFDSLIDLIGECALCFNRRSESRHTRVLSDSRANLESADRATRL